ncbi:hypothetical protein NAEGRDRAFT_80886 [Naegleria gruberi]|uniref:Uncharacterized protein n=1 Tax=Naegleria gruberi TaxID=5762 RepID=D2VQM9_NAEGR|nr:uncharacterized protein NAEGRDRAFT_80886 [Naegleria gruberi]EFC40977.1 hypothetical protein NAEGRDRAFT_80886 [Naegleria gruberi]|eukprot:XP_002673721.1 hypothetical protein NAEGRDRAFT_80886 [Naegleria gruberi strain NEG-M]
MADRLISSVLGKYLSVFIKNWGKDALSLSFMKGSGSLNNLFVNEQVIQEVLPIDFLQVMDAHVNQLSIRLPGLTRLTNDPLIITLDKLVINLEEPTKPFVKKTPLKDFLEKNRGSQGDEGSSSSKTGTSKYGFVDRIIDGLKIVVNRVEINIKTLGPIPSTQIGPYTPHVLQILVKGFTLQTTDYRFKPVPDLKQAIPKVDKNPFVWVHRMGTIESISISLIPSSVFSSTGIKSTPSANSFLPNSDPIKLLNDITCNIFITMKKRAVTVGKQSSLLSINAEIILPKIAITLRQDDIKALIRVLLAFKSASARQDLIQPKDPLTTYVKRTKRSGSQSSLSSKSSKTSMTNTTTTARQSKAISKFFVDNNGDEEDSDDEAKLEEELAEMDGDLNDMEIITDDMIKKSSTPQDTVRKCIVVNLNEFSMTFLYSRDENNQPKQVVGRENRRVLGYYFEMLGFQLGLVMPEDTPEDKNIQLGIPFIQFKEITTSFKGQGNLSETAASFLDLELIGNHNTTDNELKDENYIIQPQIFKEEFEEDDFVSHHAETTKIVSPTVTGSHSYTVNLDVWPEFLSTHRYYPDYTKTDRVYRPNSVIKRKFFEEGKEMVRLKFVKGEGMEFILECRVNPINIMLDVRRLIRLLEFSLECLPDMSVKPPVDSIIQLGKPLNPTGSLSSMASTTKSAEKLKVSPSSNSINSSNSDYNSDEESGGDEKSFSFLVEIRSPKIFIPSNYSPDLMTDVNEIVCIDNRELIITSDPRIRKQSEWGKKDKDSLFAPKSIDTFPSSGSDYSSLHSSLWEVLPNKFKVKISDFLIQIMPSIHSPPQRIMEPLSLTFDLGINDETLSDYHAKLPKIVLLTFIENLNFHMNQSQVILLLEFIRTFVDDPPMIKSFLIQSTKSFHDHNIDLFKKPNQPQPIIEAPKEDIRLIPLMFMSKIAKLEVSITASSATSMEAFFSSQYDPSLDAKLLTMVLSGAEVLVETNNTTKVSNFLTVKSKIAHFEITSPQNGENPSSIMVSHMHSSISQKSPYVFPMYDKTKSPGHMIVFRYEHPMDLNADTKKSPATPSDQPQMEPHRNSNFLRNPRLILKANGLHIGLNTDTAYHVLHFLNSRENAFDVSPMEIMNRTVKRTYSKIREKYLPEKKKAQEEEEELVSQLPTDFLESETGITSPKVEESLSPKDSVEVLEENQEEQTQQQQESSLPQVAGQEAESKSAATSPSEKDEEDEEPLTDEEMNTEEGDDSFEIITSESAFDTPKETPTLTLTMKEIDSFVSVEVDSSEKKPEPISIATGISTPTIRTIEPAKIERKTKESTAEIIPVIKEEIIPTIKTELIPVIKTVAKKIKDTKKKPQVVKEQSEEQELTEEEEDKKTVQEFLATTHQTFYPMLFDISLEEVEVYVIGKGQGPNAVGVEIKTLGVTHLPTRSIMEGATLPMFDSLYRIEHLDRISKQPVQSFSNRSHEYELKLYGTGTNVHCLIKTGVPFKSLDDINSAPKTSTFDNLEVVPLTSAPVDWMIGLINDYTKPLSKRGIWFQAMDPSLGHSENSLRIEIKPEMVYVISKLLRSQFKDIKQWADMLQGYFAMFADKKTLLIIKKFQNLGDLIAESQRSFTKTLIEHYSLTRLFNNMHSELNDKTEALNEAIKSKIHLTEVLADMQNQQSSIKTPSKQPQAVTNTPKVDDNKKNILIEGPCKVLTHSSNTFKRIHCVLLDTCEILCLTQKLPPQSFVKDSTNAIDKYLFYHMALSDTTEYIKTQVPIEENQPMPKEVLAIINGNEKRLFIYPETPNQLADWIRLSARVIEELRIKNMRIDMSVQTDIGRDFFETRKQEVDDKKNEEIVNRVLTDESIEHQNRELRGMQKQFEIIKNSLRVAAEEEFSLRVEFSQLHEYIQSFRKEQENREQSISTYLTQESETRKLLNQQKHLTKQLQSECDLRDRKITDLDFKLKEEKKKFKKAQEETNALHRTLREHIIQLQQDLQKTQIDKGKVEKEYNVLVKRQIQQTERALKMEKKGESAQIVRGEINDQQLVNAELKNIISDLYVQLAELKQQNQNLQMQNLELQTKLLQDKLTEPQDEVSPAQTGEIKLETVLSFSGKDKLLANNNGASSPTDDHDRKPLPTIPQKNLPTLPVLPPNQRPTTGQPNNGLSTPSLRERGATIAGKLTNTAGRLRSSFIGKLSDLNTPNNPSNNK